MRRVRQLKIKNSNLKNSWCSCWSAGLYWPKKIIQKVGSTSLHRRIEEGHEKGDRKLRWRKSFGWIGWPIRSGLWTVNIFDCKQLNLYILHSKWLEKKETAASSSKLVSGEKSSAEAVQGVSTSRDEEPESEMKSEERKSKKDKKKKDKSKKEKKKHHRGPSTERRKHKRRRSHSPEPERERDRRHSKS